VFLVKLSASGEPIWARSFGSELNDEAYSMDILPDGGVVIAGACYGGGPFGPPAGGGIEAFVARLDAQGTLDWSHVFGGAGPDRAKAVRFAANGDVVAAGSLSGTLDFGDGPITTDGEDAFVARWTAKGAQRWARVFGGPLTQQVESLAADATSAMFATGAFQGSIAFGDQSTLDAAGTRDVFVVRVALSGDAVWSRGFGAAGTAQRADGLGVIGDHLYLAGALDGSVDFGSELLTAVDPPDVYVAALRTDDGTSVWSRRFGLSGNQAYRGMGLDAGPGGLVIAGDFGDGSVDFGAGVLTAADPGDGFIVQLEP
jgi:hypothetical protein